MDESETAIAGTSRRAVLALLGILLLALLIRLPGLATFGYGVDEGNTASEAILLVDQHHWRFWDIETRKLHPLSGSMPVSYYIAALGLETIGRDFVGLRVPFLVLGMLSLFLTWLVARRLLGSTVIAGLATLFLALNPAHVAYSQFARFYIPILTMGLLWVLALHRHVERPTIGTTLALAAVLVFGYLTHHLFPLLGPIGIVYVGAALVRPEPSAPVGYRRRLALLTLLAVAASSPPAIVNNLELFGAGGQAATVEGSRGLAEGVRNCVRAAGGALLRIEPALLLLALVGAWTAIRHLGRTGLLLALLGFALAAETVGMGMFGQVRGRYVIWCLPFLAMLAALAVTRTTAGRPRGNGVAVIASLLVLALGLSVADYHRHGDGRVGACEIRTAAQDLAGDSRIVILGGGPPPAAMRLAGWDVDRVIRIATPDLRRAGQVLEPYLDERLVLVVHEQTVDPVRKTSLWDDPRLVLRDRIVDPTRRQNLSYLLLEWRSH